MLGGKSCVAQGKAFGGVLCKNDPKICGAKGGRGNKGKPKSEEHKLKMRLAWIERKKKMKENEN